VGATGQQIDGALDGCRKIEVESLELELARFDLRKIEDVVDDGE
jgi:hypothetical protein